MRLQLKQHAETGITLQDRKTELREHSRNTIAVSTYVCLEIEGSYPNIHYDKGMHGQLIVEQ
jgi:hypothetical protein